MIYLILLLISGVKMPGEVFTFTTTGSTFNPIIVLSGSPDFHWFFSNNTYSTLQDPANIDFGSIADRDQKFWIEDYTKITQIDWGNKDVEFNINELQGMTGMTSLNLYNTSCSGDIAELSGMTGITYLRLSSTSCSYTSTSLPNWSGAEIQIYSCGLDFSEVDDFIIDLDTGTGADDTGGTLNIAGTNEARTSASDDEKASLIAKNWTITVNE